MEAITLTIHRAPGEPPRSWRARAVGLAHQEAEARGLELRSIRFGAAAGVGDVPDEGGVVEIVVTGETGSRGASPGAG